MNLKYLSLLVAFVSCTTSHQIVPKKNDEKTKFKSIEKFNGDTIAYNVYNFIDRKDQFIGKPASLVLDNINYEIKSYLYATDLEGKIYGIYVFPYTRKERIQLEFKKIRYVNLIVEFNQKIAFDSLLNIYPQRRIRDFDWSPTLKEFFGKFKVSNVKQLDSTEKK
jgi:hypothetical protein